MKFCHRLVVFTLLVAMGLFLVTPPALASAGAGLKVLGVKLMTEVSPGQVITHKMTVITGEEQSPLDILVDVGGFGESPDMSYQFLSGSKDDSPYSARTFITLDRTEFHLEPGHPEEITATITVPKDVGAGGRYALINIRSQPFGEGDVGIAVSAVVPIMLTISGTDIIQTGSITDLSASDVTSGQPIVISTTLKNIGNHHYYEAQNVVRLTDEKGNEVAVASTPPSASAIIPACSVRFDVTFEQKLPPGRYSVDSKVTLENGIVLDKAEGNFEVKAETKEPEIEEPELEEPVQPAGQPTPTEQEWQLPARAPESRPIINWPVVGGIGGGVIILIVLVIYLLITRRRSYYR